MYGVGVGIGPSVALGVMDNVGVEAGEPQPARIKKRAMVVVRKATFISDL
jgi:hypothetical protein